MDRTSNSTKKKARRKGLKTNPRESSSSEKKRLERLAKDPNLDQRIAEAFEQVGITGEGNSAKLVYVVFTSRLLANPAAVVVRGPSGVGKSQLLNGVASLFPAGSKIEAMKLTQASLFNVPDDYFRHKILITGERKHATDDVTRDQNALIRQLISEKRISRMVSVQDESGWLTKNIIREGPIAYGECTTADSIFEEDLNRMLQVFLNDGEQQTRNVMRATARSYRPSHAKVDVSSILELHHAFQESLQRHDIRIPFAEQLADLLPAEKVESRRIFQQVLTVVEAIALLYQHQRGLQNDCLIATLDDYALARQLLLKPIHASLGLGDKFQRAAPLREQIPNGQFTSAEVKNALGYESKMGASHLLKRLKDDGLIECSVKRSGRRAAKYRWVAHAQWNILPSIRKLKSLVTV